MASRHAACDSQGSPAPPRPHAPSCIPAVIFRGCDGFGLIEFNVEEIRGATPELRGHAALYPEWARTYLDGIAGGTPRLGAALPQPAVQFPHW